MPPAVIAAADVARGTRRLLWQQGLTAVPEVTLPDGHRADLMALGPDGRLLIVEIKVSAADLAGDTKWQAYLAYADSFAWAVPPHLSPLLDAARFRPHETGLIVADRHEALWLRAPGPACSLNASRRRALHLAFARTAAQRLHQMHDPGYEGWAIAGTGFSRPEGAR